ncbi:MAG: ABC transporter permease [Bacteroidota bacterium]
MLTNYFKIAFRNIFRTKVYSSINIIGLTLGLGCSLLLFLFVIDELSFDRFHAKSDRIYRLDTKYEFQPSFVGNVDFPSAFAPAIQEQIASVKEVTRVDLKSPATLLKGSEYLNEESLMYTDPSFLRLFDFELIKGDPETALSAPYQVVITQELEAKYFPDGNGLGNTLNINQEDYTVTGVFDDIPLNTHFQLGVVVSFKTIENDEEAWSIFPNYQTFIELEKGADVEDILTQARHILINNVGEPAEQYQPIEPVSLTSIYLNRSYLSYDQLRGNIEYVRIFLITGILLLVIASINYMNLATARASLRSTEIGVRKVNGAYRKEIIQQFLTESILIALISSVLSLLLVEALLPSFNALTGKTLSIHLISNPLILVQTLGIGLTVGILSGLYPAMVLSGLRPATILKGQLTSGKKGVFLRKALVVTQFTITIGLTISTIIISRQFSYLSERGLGIETEALVSLPIKSQLEEQYQPFKQALLQHPDIQNVSMGSILLGSISFETFADDDPRTNRPSGSILQVYPTDFDFLKTTGVALLAGRDFDPANSADATRSILINETAQRSFGWDTPEQALGEEIVFNDTPHVVVGVVADFHVFGPDSHILPKAIYYTDRGSDQVLIRLQTENLSASVDQLKATWKAFLPYLPFEIHFMDQELEKAFISEQNLKTLFSGFSILTICIACLGLFGLASFATEQRRKEIGIRKVLGASVEKIVTMITKDFILLIGIGFLIASPVAWLFSRQWIENYAYRIDIDAWVFILAGGIAVASGLITVGYQSLKASLANPVDSLRND